MNIPEEKKEGYLTLKEAGEAYGYSADYIGQLIRKGKLEGKQVYASVVWMTTREAMERYMSGEHAEGVSEPAPLVAEDADDETSPGIVGKIFHDRLQHTYRRMLYILLILISLLAIFVLYMLSVFFDFSSEWRTKEARASEVTHVALTIGHEADITTHARAHGTR